ncbi:phospholipase A1 VesT1.02 isoform X1 [Bactrocera dorsalis]|uniref:Phospholipase A1 VesT1.02 isoform X1 n=1 Tax=Bactrocera dorsalis TaxID=27457 RepID=A0A6I9VS58_BACDO|nr:phospholipase A1 VesT1.02 isoform X1 [Bactrocera dorsalis]
MKVLVLLAIFALTASAAPLDDEDDNGRVSGENGWYVPQLDGSLVWMSTEEGENLLAEYEKKEEMEGRALSLSPVTYYLYTKSNHYDAQKITANKKTISDSHFDADHPTRFLIHGWTQGYEADMNTQIRDAWLSHGDYNIIVVDWGRARSVEYVSSVAAVPGVGKKVASMIDYMVSNNGLNLDTLEVIGHSLGAQVAGYVGKNVGAGKIHGIVGLDPALPLFSYDKPNKRLNSDDAHYVESIQTNGGKLGFLKPIGKGAFYPNGGKKQPGCGTDLTGSCSHARSCIYYAEAVRENNFPSMRCGDYEDAVKKDCGGQYSGVKMGAVYNYEFVSGDYYVPVRSTAPYGYGS